MMTKGKFRKHDFEIAVGPKGSPGEPTFWSSLEAQKIGTIIWIDITNLQSPHRKFQPNWPKNG